MDLTLLDNIPYFLKRWYGRVEENPDKVILVDGRTGETLTAGETEDLSGRIYAYLKKAGIKANDFVMIDMPRGLSMVICMLGVWKAGAAFTVVEDDYAPDRIEYIRKDVNCRVFLGATLYEQIRHEEYREGFTEAANHDAAFAVYTSGTTGFPKGVLHEYGNIRLNRLSSKTGKRVSGDDCYALISPFNFIASVKIVLAFIQNGFTLFIIPYEIVKNPLKLNAFFIGHKISVAFLSPSLLRIIGTGFGPDMKVVFTGSEPANGLFLDGISLVNSYSMSEAAFTLAQFRVDRPYDVCPVGKPNSEHIVIHILDEEGRDVPDGETGEIAFENPFMRGYINLPEETAKALRDGLYHTGDLGKKLPDGNLILLGRANDMIKINGNRIEPAEIEEAFKKATNATWCLAKGFEEPERSFICLYYTDDLSFDEAKMKEKLGSRLPYYMIPSYYVKIDRIPLLPTGKVDKKALKAPGIKQYKTDYVPPTDEFETKLCESVAKVLKLDRVGLNDDFFLLGGDSLKTMALLAELKEEGLTAADIYSGSVIREIAGIYRKKSVSGSKTGQQDETETEKEAGKKACPLTATQMKIYQSQMSAEDKAMWGLSLTYRLDDVNNAGKICDALNRVIAEYPIFRTVVETDGEGIPVQRFDPSVITPAKTEHVTKEEFEQIKQTFAGIYKMTGCPLYKAAVYIVEETEAYLFIEFHHLIVDGLSFGLFHKALYAAYMNEPLPPDTFYTYLKSEAGKKDLPEYHKARDYFIKKYGNRTWDVCVKPDRNEKEEGVGKRMVPLKDVSTEVLKDFETKSGFSKNALFLLASLLAQRECNHADHPYLNWVFHNRTDEVTNRAMGIVYRHLPVGLDITGEMRIEELLTEIKKQSNDGIRYSICDWVAESEKVPENDSVMFVYETTDITSGGIAKKMGFTQFWIPYNQQTAIFRFVVQVYDMPNARYLLLFYRTRYYSEEIAERYEQTMLKVLGRILKSENLHDMTVSELIE